MAQDPFAGFEEIKTADPFAGFEELPTSQSKESFIKSEAPGLAKRILPGIGGNVIGSSIGTVIFPGPGTIAGGMIGGGLSSGAGEYWAEKGEVDQGKRQRISIPQILTQGALGAIPGLGLSKGLSIPAKLLVRGAEGAGMGAVSNTATSLAEGNGVPSAPEIAKSAAIGLPLGVAGGSVEQLIGKYLPKIFGKKVGTASNPVVLPPENMQLPGRGSFPALNPRSQIELPNDLEAAKAIEAFKAGVSNINGKSLLPPVGGTTNNSVIQLPENLNAPGPLPTAPNYGPGIGDFSKNRLDTRQTIDPDTFKVLFPNLKTPNVMRMPERQNGQLALPPSSQETFRGPGMQPTGTSGYNTKIDFPSEPFPVPAQFGQARLGPPQAPPKVPLEYTKQIRAPFAQPAQAIEKTDIASVKNTSRETITDRASNAWASAQARKQASIDKMVEDGASELTAKKKANKNFERFYNEALRDENIEPNIVFKNKAGQPDLKYRPSEKKDPLYLFNEIQDASGEKTGQVYTDLVESTYKKTHLDKRFDTEFNEKPIIKKLNKLGIKNSDISYLMQYYRTKDGVTKFDPSALEVKGKYKYEQFDPSGFGEKELTAAQPYLAELRSMFDKMHSEASGGVPDLGYISGYVPKQGGIHTTNGATSEGVLNPSYANSRTTSNKIPGQEEDFGKLMNGYKRKVVRDLSFKDTLEKGLETSQRLRMRGAGDLATRLDRVLADNIGFKDPKELYHYRIDEKSLPIFKEAIDRNDVDPKLATQAYNEVKKLAVETWIGMNPKLIGMSALQPEQIGSQTTGLKHVVGARLSRLTGEKIPQHVEEKLYGIDSYKNNFELENSVPNKIIRGTGAVLSAPFAGKAGLKAMDVFDKEGRRVMYLAGRNKFLGNRAQAMKDLLLESERQNVRDAMRRGGSKAAAEQYGISIARQTMDIMSKVGRPEHLRSGVGKEVQFTSYTRGRKSRGQELLRQGKGKQLAKEIATGAAFSAIVGSGTYAVTGDEKSGLKAAAYSNPHIAIPALLAMKIAPHMLSIVDDLNRNGPIHALKTAFDKQTPLGATIKQLNK